MHTHFVGFVMSRLIYFIQKLTTALPESAVWENGCTNYFTIYVHDNYVAGLGFKRVTLVAAVRHLADCASKPSKENFSLSVIIYKQVHYKSYKITCVPHEDSDHIKFKN